MVCIGLWRNVALLALCQSQLQKCSDAISIIERDVEPIAFTTSAATSDSTPIWLVLPLLLDVQPVLMKLEVTRHVPAQVQSFCREHRVDVSRCTGAIRQALDDVVDLQQFCKTSTAENALPGFVVARDVLQETKENASALWMQNESGAVALDFCDFAGARDQCAVALENALQLTFDWMLHLTPCEKHGATDTTATLVASEPIVDSIDDRLAAVEQLIAELHRSSVAETTEVQPPTSEQQDIGDSEITVSEEVQAVNQPPESAEAAIIGKEDKIADNVQVIFSVGPSEELCAVVPPVDNGIDETISEAEQLEVIDDDVSTLQSGGVQDEATGIEEYEDLDSDGKIRLTLGEELPVPEESKTSSHTTQQLAESEVTEIDHGSCGAEYSAELSRVKEDLRLPKTWKVGAALVLALSIVYLAIDLMMQCVHLPKQLACELLHNIFLLVRGEPQSKLAEEYSQPNRGDDLKKPTLRMPKVSPQETLNKQSNAEDSATSSALVQPPCHPSPSFTCVAMMLMAGRQAPIQLDTLPIMQHTIGFENLSVPTFEQNSSDAVNTFHAKGKQEQDAVQRIQKLWKTSKSKRSFPNTTAAQDDIGLAFSDPSAPIFRLLQLRSKKAAEIHRADKPISSFHRHVPSTMPPR